MLSIKEGLQISKVGFMKRVIQLFAVFSSGEVISGLKFSTVQHHNDQKVFIL